MLISLAFYALQAVLPETQYKNLTFLGGCTVLNESNGAEPGWGVFSEAILTFILVLTVLTTVANEKHCQLAPLCIGFSVVVTSSAGYQIFVRFATFILLLGMFSTEVNNDNEAFPFFNNLILKRV